MCDNPNVLFCFLKVGGVLGKKREGGFVVRILPVEVLYPLVSCVLESEKETLSVACSGESGIVGVLGLEGSPSSKSMPSSGACRSKYSEATEGGLVE